MAWGLFGRRGSRKGGTGACSRWQKAGGVSYGARSTGVRIAAQAARALGQMAGDGRWSRGAGPEREAAAGAGWWRVGHCGACPAWAGGGSTAGSVASEWAWAAAGWAGLGIVVWLNGGSVGVNGDDMGVDGMRRQWDWTPTSHREQRLRRSVRLGRWAGGGVGPAFNWWPRGRVGQAGGEVNGRSGVQIFAERAGGKWPGGPAFLKCPVGARKGSREEPGSGKPAKGSSSGKKTSSGKAKNNGQQKPYVPTATRKLPRVFKKTPKKNANQGGKKQVGKGKGRQT
ncbi:hypothetical protein BV25DRAFT_1843043 [Artomyces pyxidatus]|uniref:Uncharacterized protein n=1 Tax=Artomyces pyxidatus TaxID=48021 RepID=A0ACB8SFS3_9AGAM|nr:hypothetical protein BV25DRAFT_1843043 [Artomyces pyxidatus]